MIVAVAGIPVRQGEIAGTSLEAIDFVRKKVGSKILTRLTDVESIKGALLQYQKSLKAEFGDIIQQEAQSVRAVAEDEANPTSENGLQYQRG